MKQIPTNNDIVKCASASNYDLLKERMQYPMKAKLMLTKQRIEEWYEYHNGQVYVAFSGGKDSTVLLHIVRSLYPEVPAVFCDTGLEFPENRTFVKSIENVTWLKPAMSFKAALEKYGFPLVSKEVSQKVQELQTTKSEKLRNIRLHGNEKGHGKCPTKWQYLADAPFKISSKCCDIYKKNPSKKYEKETGRVKFVGTMTDESALRTQSYLKTGCNSYEQKNPRSAPMSFWTEGDVWEYINEFNVPYSKIYDMGYDRTGCIFCPLGIQYETGVNRFQKLAVTHPKLHKYAMEDLGYRDKLAIIGVTELDAKDFVPTIRGIPIVVENE